MAVEVALPNLSGIKLFDGLDPRKLHDVEAACRWRTFRQGETILEYGSPSREVCFVAAGCVTILNVTEAGREVAFADIEAGDCFGDFAAIDGEPRSASVVAAEDCLIAAMDADRFLALLREEPEITFRLLQRVIHMVRMGDVRIMELSTLAATHRVYAELLRMAVPDAAGQGMWVVRPLPALQDIARRVGTTRETAARALMHLYPTGLARRKGRNLYIIDRKGFEHWIGSIKRRGAEPPMM